MTTTPPYPAEEGRILTERIRRAVNDQPLALALAVITDVYMACLYQLSEGDYDKMRGTMLEALETHRRIVNPGPTVQ